MSIKSDKWIRKMSLEHDMISPFEDKQVSSQKISYGFSSYGYDIRVADEYKIRMALHPHDPAMPRPEGFRGVDRVLGSVEGLKKFINLHPSNYHGLNFCQGTVTEMLEKPSSEIFDVIRYFGERKKIFNVIPN